jgi:hypothetical protein
MIHIQMAAAYPFSMVIVSALHGYSPLSDTVKYTSIGLTTAAMYVRACANFHTSKALSPGGQLAAILFVPPIVSAFTWFTGKNVGRAWREVNEKAHPSVQQAQA